MQKNELKIVENKAVLYIRERMCETAEEMLESDMNKTSGPREAAAELLRVIGVSE